ncbi:hypothetical protein HOY34_17245 [Xinfangfangia sp. D13-10-4-6]|uniref:hypothetical protein n=1 Tax=Pseudogemmobacter hezensis TaxID=2737662 RepID=UPI001552127E|nr:hypothetical protein [Pseudogemmobacter hezensis]NPD16941.1 hypothetical protein [Pseudogemmobacter hezensis]
MPYYGDLQIHSEMIGLDAHGDEQWEAWLEFHDRGTIGRGDTELSAERDLIDRLNAEGEEWREMQIAAMDDKAHAARSRSMGL